LQFHLIKNLVFFDSKEAVLEGADALVLVTEWPEFSHLDFKLLRSTLRSPVVFDGRNMYQPELMAANGIIYHAIGRKQRG